MEYPITSEDCMGKAHAYWRAERTCSDGKLILAVGDSKQEASDRADRKVQEHEDFLKKSPMGQLKALCAGELLDTDQRTAIRLIAQILEKRNINESDSKSHFQFRG